MGGYIITFIQKTTKSLYAKLTNGLKVLTDIHTNQSTYYIHSHLVTQLRKGIICQDDLTKSFRK